jgi:hypothetical protein
MKRHLLSICLALGIAAVASPLHARHVCESRAATVDSLSSRYGEARVAAGLSSEGYVVELFRGRDDGTWKSSAMLPDGKACVISTGESWVPAAAALAVGTGA